MTTAHNPDVIEITEQGWRDAGYRYLVWCECGYRKETIARETADLTADDHRRNNG